jgi:L-histidine N-alpha-methyltransferase
MRRSHFSVAAQVLEAVDKGLSKKNKALPSWLLYDESGDRIFQTIMHLPEYYPTRCEYRLLAEHKGSLLSYFNYDSEDFQLVDLGAGDGYKTQILLEYFLKESVQFKYIPCDVSLPVLEQLGKRLGKALPELAIQPICGYHEEVLAQTDHASRRVLLFLGSNIGNHERNSAMKLLETLGSQMTRSDLMLIGFDLKKNPRTIALAYDDPRGVTKAFNMNLLVRLNDELGANFDLRGFTHYPDYDPMTGEAKSYLVSTKKQSVFIDALGKTFHFELWEPIHTETSQKYDLRMIEHLVNNSGFEIVEVFFDEKKHFCDVLIRKY